MKRLVDILNMYRLQNTNFKIALRQYTGRQEIDDEFLTLLDTMIKYSGVVDKTRIYNDVILPLMSKFRYRFKEYVKILYRLPNFLNDTQIDIFLEPLIFYTDITCDDFFDYLLSLDENVSNIDIKVCKLYFASYIRSFNIRGIEWLSINSLKKHIKSKQLVALLISVELIERNNILCKNL